MGEDDSKNSNNMRIGNGQVIYEFQDVTKVHIEYVIKQERNLMFRRKKGNGRDIKFGLWILYIRFRKKIIKSNTIKRRDKTKKY